MNDIIDCEKCDQVKCANCGTLMAENCVYVTDMGRLCFDCWELSGQANTIRNQTGILPISTTVF